MNEEDELIDEAESIVAKAWGEDFVPTEKELEILNQAFDSKHSRIIYLPLVSLLGLMEGIFVSQLRGMLKYGKSRRVIEDHRGKWWAIYNTYDEWVKILPFCSHRSFRRIISKLEKVGIVYSKRIPTGKYYGLNFRALAYFLQNPEKLRKLLG